MGRPAIDLTGERIGMLTVLRRASPPPNAPDKNRPYWQCRCDCGKIVLKPSSYLRNDNATHDCGCAKALDVVEERPQVDLTGKRYGMLEVIGRADPPKVMTRRDNYWRCRCDCGKERTFRQRDLIGRDSCGCKPPERQGNAAAIAARKRQAEERREEIMRRTGCTKSEYAAIGALVVRQEVCPVCKRTFDLLSTSWAYKTYRQRRGYKAVVYYCSWTCFRKAE